MATVYNGRITALVALRAEYEVELARVLSTLRADATQEEIADAVGDNATA